MNNTVLIDIALITVYKLFCLYYVIKNVFAVNKQIIIIGYCPAVYLIYKSTKS